jgi:hypothetical protein
MKCIPYVLLLVAVVAPAHAEEVTKGYLEKATESSLTVELKSGARRHFTTADQISVQSESGQLTLKNIPKHSKVQVVERNGLAELVIVEEMPQ